MGDVGYFHLLLLQKSVAGKLDGTPTCRTECLAAVDAAFRANIRRIIAVIISAPILAHVSARHQKMQMEAVFAVLNKVSLDAKDLEDEELRSRLLTKFHEICAADAASFTEDPQAADKAMLEGMEALQLFINANPDSHWAVALDANMASMLLSAWTAFEVLAGDLWVASLNARPRLGFTALGAEPNAADNEDEQERKRKLTFPIPVRLLQKWDYDLKDRMGTLLRRIKKWDFARRQDTKDAYIKAFGKSESELVDIFDDQKVRWLSAIRNAIVHNGQIADQEFVTLVAKHPTLSAISEGDNIRLESGMVADLINAMIDRGIALMGFVDVWLLKNQQ